MKSIFLTMPFMFALIGCDLLIPPPPQPVELPQHCAQFTLDEQGDTMCDGMTCDPSTAMCDTEGCSCTAFALPPTPPEPFSPPKPRPEPNPNRHKR